jgi:hypothetical protein
VERLVLKGVEFVPGELTTADGRDQLAMTARDARAANALRRDDSARAHVSLRDGRALDVRVAITSPRPSAQLMDKSAQRADNPGVGSIRLASPDELPQDAQLTFSLRSQSPMTFTHEDKVEVATADGSSSTVLDVASGALTLQNARVAVATLVPAKALGPSAFGPLRYRLVSNGVAGEWRPLATLVRLPVLKAIDCPRQPAEAVCTLTGNNLFLLDSVSGAPQFAQPTQVPDGFPGRSLRVPRPSHGQLYVKLRDDPAVINVVDLGIADEPAQAAGGATPTPAPPVTPPQVDESQAAPPAQEPTPARVGAAAAAAGVGAGPQQAVAPPPSTDSTPSAPDAPRGAASPLLSTPH